jgi:hypothetical protein
MYLPYEILRNLAPDELTGIQQREVDNQLGRLAAGLMRRGRPEGRPAECSGRSTGLRVQSRTGISKLRRDATRPGGRAVRPAG